MSDTECDDERASGGAERGEEETSTEAVEAERDGNTTAERDTATADRLGIEVGGTEDERVSDLEGWTRD